MIVCSNLKYEVPYKVSIAIMNSLYYELVSNYLHLIQKMLKD